MNKRQAKKMRKKVIYPLVDEMNLLTLSPEEYKVAMKDFDNWIQKHCRYKHYKDKYQKAVGRYYFPVGEKVKAGMATMSKQVRRYGGELKIITVTQESTLTEEQRFYLMNQKESSSL